MCRRPALRKVQQPIVRDPSMSEPRTIKKYPNRRLYDTVESRYITLADIRRLVIERVDFVVIDKKTQGDITRSILLQVIAEQEHDGEDRKSTRLNSSHTVISYAVFCLKKKKKKKTQKTDTLVKSTTTS